MNNNIEELFNGEAPEILLKPGHKPAIYTVGWGEPPTYHSECTCGWRGRTIETNVPEMLLPQLKELTKVHGDEAILGPGSLFGNGRSAVREVLGHLDLPIEELIQIARKEIDNLSRNLGEADSWEFDYSKKLQDKLSDLDLLATVKAFLAVEPLASRSVPFDFEVYEKVQMVIQKAFARKESRLPMWLRF